MVRDPNDWTPAVGWRNLGVHMVIRGVISGLIILGVLAVLAVWDQKSGGMISQETNQRVHGRRVMSLAGVVLSIAGVLVGLVMTVRLVELTSIANKVLMLIVVVVLGLVAFAADSVLGATSLSVDVQSHWFFLPVVLGGLTGSFRLYRDM